MLQNNLFNSQLLVPRVLPRTRRRPELWSLAGGAPLGSLRTHLGVKRDKFSRAAPHQEQSGSLLAKAGGAGSLEGGSPASAGAPMATNRSRWTF